MWLLRTQCFHPRLKRFPRNSAACTNQKHRSSLHNLYPQCSLGSYACCQIPFGA